MSFTYFFKPWILDYNLHVIDSTALANVSKDSLATLDIGKHAKPGGEPERLTSPVSNCDVKQILFQLIFFANQCCPKKRATTQKRPGKVH